MKYLAVWLGLILASCVTPTARPPFFVTVETILATRTAEVEAGISTPVPTLAPGCEAHCLDGECDVVCQAEGPFEQRTNWLLLGGDYRAHREGTRWGTKTDVIVLVSVLETDPIQITVVQFPRNLYAPSSLGDVWLFGIYDEFGWQGLHKYFFEVFGVTLQGIHYINMDNFERLIDDLGGLRVSDNGGAYQFDGAGALSYLRDNENNWGMGSYDAGERVFQVLDALRWRSIVYFLEDPVAATNALAGWFDLFDTDLSNIRQLYWLFELGWRVRSQGYETAFIQLEEPVIIRGDTPIVQNEQPMRGMIADQDLRDWIRCALEIEC